MSRKSTSTVAVVETPEVETEVALEETRDGKLTAKQRKSIERFPAIDEADLDALALVARPAISPCICGCGTPTKSRFAPGHDATLKERLKNTESAAARAIEETLGW
jgi:hypothetical protein